MECVEIAQSYAAVNQIGLFSDSKDIPRSLQLNAALEICTKFHLPIMLKSIW